MDTTLHGIFFEPPIEQNFIGHIMEEVYKTRIFDSVLPAKKEGSLVIDCGANIGITSYYFSSRFDRVLAIEPAQKHMDTLKHMLAYNKIDNVTPFQFALSMYDKPNERFFHYNNKTMNSLYGALAESNPTGLQVTGSEEVALKRLDTFFTEQKIEHCDLLKVDVEGVEFEVLGSDSFGNIADKVDCVVVEVHSYAGRQPQQIVESLRTRGFEVAQIPNDATIFVGRRKGA